MASRGSTPKTPAVAGSAAPAASVRKSAGRGRGGAAGKAVDTPRTTIRELLKALPTPKPGAAAAAAPEPAASAARPSPRSSLVSRKDRPPSASKTVRFEKDTPRTNVRSLLKAIRTPTETPEDIRTALARAPVAPGPVTVASPDMSFYGGGTPSFDSGVIANITPLTARPSVIPYADARKPSFKVALTPAEQAAAGRPPLAGAVATTRTVQVTQQQQQKAGRRRKSIRMSADGVPIQGLPETLVSSMFTNFCPLVVTKEAMARVMEASHDYWEQASADLAAYSTHARRNTIEPSDVACLFERQRLTGAKTTIEDLARQYLPREYVDELVPVARAYNKIQPAKPVRP